MPAITATLKPPPHAGSDDAWFDKACARHAWLKATDGVADYLWRHGENPADWHIDISVRSYVSDFRHDIGFDVGPCPRNYKDGDRLPDGFRATAIHFPHWGARPSPSEIKRLEHIAARIFIMRLAAVSLLKEINP
jgi:hypothetical protein